MISRLIIWIVLAIVYLIGLCTIKWLDRNLREENPDLSNTVHYIILTMIWLMTPILLVVFVIQFITSKIKSPNR